MEYATVNPDVERVIRIAIALRDDPGLLMQAKANVDEFIGDLQNISDDGRAAVRELLTTRARGVKPALFWKY